MNKAKVSKTEANINKKIVEHLKYMKPELLKQKVPKMTYYDRFLARHSLTHGTVGSILGGLTSNFLLTGAHLVPAVPAIGIGLAVGGGIGYLIGLRKQRKTPIQQIEIKSIDKAHKIAKQLVKLAEKEHRKVIEQDIQEAIKNLENTNKTREDFELENL